MRNETWMNSQKTIEIQEAYGRIGYIPFAIPQNAQGNIDDIIKDRHMVDRADLTEQGTDP